MKKTLIGRILPCVVTLALSAADVGAQQMEPLFFGTPAGLVLTQVRPTKLADFEAAVSALRRAMLNSQNQTTRKQAEGWRFYRAAEPMSGNALYIFLLDPAVPNADYRVEPILYAELPKADATRVIRQFVESIATQQNRLTLTPHGTGPRTFPVPAPITTPPPAPTPSPAPSSDGRTLSESYQFQGDITGTVESRVMETNDVWWKYAWKITLKNTGRQPTAISAVVVFQDVDGFPIEETSQQGASLAAGEETVLSGFELVTAAVAPRVGKVDLKLKKR
jgi:hypothetical protein